jgi:predicted dehydrogenase
MSGRITRRGLFKGAAAGAVAVGGSRLFESPYIMAQTPAKKLRLAVIGCGGRGGGTLVPVAARENLVAMCDVDSNKFADAIKSAKKSVPTFTGDGVKTYSDYRKMFDEMHKEIDAVFIATPNHHHALPALIAMQHGIGVYVEKPMSYDIHEARLMAEYAKKYKVATQMGNQGHSGDGYRVLCEYIWGGAIGDVTEVYHWSDCSNGGFTDKFAPKAAPANLNWDAWIGPAPYREFHDELHPHSWHGWHDFGGGALGNRGCHIMDGAHWALKLGGPCAIELEDANGGTKTRFPVSDRIRWDFPQRGDLPPVKVWWYDGKRKGGSNQKGELADSVAENDRVLPPLLIELIKKEGKDRFATNGTLYKGTKGLMYTGFYGEGARILPEEQHKATPAPPKKLERLKGGHFEDFLRGVRDPAHKPCANFEVSAPLTEYTLLGCLAIKAGLNQKVEWDGDKCTNRPEINNYLRRDYRKGWEVPKLG